MTPLFMPSSFNKMKKRIMDIYEKMFARIYESSKDYRKTWNHLIEFIMLNSYPPFFFMVEHKFEWLFDTSNLANDLMKIWNQELLKSDNHDYLGELLIKYKKELGYQYRKEILELSDETTEQFEEEFREKKGKVNILIIGTKTGRSLLKIHEINPNIVIYGIEKDLKLYRITFANCALHGIDFHILCCNPLKHAFDNATENGKHNWQYTNRWYPYWSKLKPKPMANKLAFQR
jgi:hypothetical protein